MTKLKNLWKFGKAIERLSGREVTDDEVIRAIRSVPRHYAGTNVAYAGDNANIGRSPILWNRGGGAAFPWLAVQENPKLGSMIWENFLQFSGQPGLSTTALSGANSPASVASNTAAFQSLAMSGSLTTDKVISILKPTLQTGLSISLPAIVGSNNSISINFVNSTGTAITPTAGETYTAIVLRQNAFYTGSHSGGWRSQEGSSTAGSITNLTTDYPTGIEAVGNAFGTIRLATGAAAHNSVALEGLGAQYGLGSNAAVTIPVANTFPKLYFEARVRFNQSTVQSAFIGLGDPGLTSGMNTLFSSGDVYQQKNVIGWRINGATSTTAINAGYGASGVGWVTAASGAVPTTLTNWTKLGFVFDPFDVQPLRYYQDGVLIAQQGLTTAGNLTGITAASWPSNVALVPLLYLQAQGSGGAQVTLDVDWIAVGELLDTP